MPNRSKAEAQDNARNRAPDFINTAASDLAGSVRDDIDRLIVPGTNVGEFLTLIEKVEALGNMVREDTRRSFELVWPNYEEDEEFFDNEDM